jgi:hypothetical protein
MHLHELTKNPAILMPQDQVSFPTDRLLAYRGTYVEQGDSLVPTEINEGRSNRSQIFAL